MSEMNYREVSCQKAVSNDEFARGVQDFVFSIGAPSVWFPKKSYFKISLKGSVPTGPGESRPLQTSDCVAFSDDVCGGLYNNCFFRIGGQDVSTINNYIAQASILKYRTGKSNAWLKSVGNSQSFVESDFGKRVARTANDAPSDLTPRPTVIPIAQGITDPAQPVTVALANDGVVTGINVLFGRLLNDYVNADGYVDDVLLYINKKGYKVREVLTQQTLSVVATGYIIPATADAYFVIQKPFDSDGKNEVQVIWQPPIGIFTMEDIKSEHEALGAGDYRISLNPNSSYKFSCLETTRLGAPSLDVLKPAGALVPSSTGFFNIEVLDVKFYMAYAKMEMPVSGIRQLSLQEMLILSKPLSGYSNTYEFSVPSSTNTLAVFVQSSAVNSNCAYPPSKFKLLNNGQNQLTGIQITYGNVTKPSTKWASAFSNNKNDLIQRYHDNLSECGLLMNHGGAETLQDYLDRGWYILYTFLRDQSDKSTQVQVSLDFNSTTALEANASVYLCAYYDRQVEITTSNGMTVSVRSQN